MFYRPGGSTAPLSGSTAHARTEHITVGFGSCHGIVTADVLELGLNRGAIAGRKLKGVKRDKEYEGLYWFGPLW